MCTDDLKHINALDRMIEQRDKRIRELEDALRQIADHPHNSCYVEREHIESESQRQQLMGIEDGHRCAAAIARKALGRE